MSKWISVCLMEDGTHLEQEFELPWIIEAMDDAGIAFVRSMITQKCAVLRINRASDL